MKKFIVGACITLILMAVLIKIAYTTREYFAIGGEWLIWAYPLLIWTIKRDKYDSADHAERRNDEII